MKKDIIIASIPFEKNENLREKVIFLADKKNIEINNHDINTTHRLKKRGQPIPAMIVRLNNRDVPITKLDIKI